MKATGTISALIRPSDHMLIAALTMGVVSIFGVIYVVLYSSPDVVQYFDYQAANPSGMYAEYRTVETSVNSSSFAADAALFTFWLTIGLLCYAALVTTMRMVESYRALKAELRHRQDVKRAVIRDAARRMVLRLSGVAGIYALGVVSANLAVPYFLWSVHSAQGNLLAIALQSSLIFAYAVTLVYVVAVSLRLIRLRTRNFGRL